MKILHFIVLMVVMFILALWIGKQRSGIDPTERIAWSLAWGWVMTVTGGILAAISAMVLLQRGLAGAALGQILPLVIALLGGLLIYQGHWALAVALAAIVIGWAVLDFLRAKQGGKE